MVGERGMALSGVPEVFGRIGNATFLGIPAVFFVLVAAAIAAIGGLIIVRVRADADA